MSKTEHIMSDELRSEIQKDIVTKLGGEMKTTKGKIEREEDWPSPPINKKYCCTSMEQMIEKGWVKHRKLANKMGGNRKFFIVETNIPSTAPKKYSTSNVNILLDRCFRCGKEIYPR